MQISGHDPNWVSEFAFPDIISESFLQLRSPLVSSEALAEPREPDFALFSSTLPRASIDEGELDLENPGILPGGDVGHPRNAGTCGKVHSAAWSLADSTYERIRLDVQAHVPTLPDGCNLPSCNSLSHGLQVYLSCVQKMLPFIHVPTFSEQERPTELLLALACLGYQYRFEDSKANQLFFVTRLFLIEKQRRDDMKVASSMLLGRDDIAPNHRGGIDRIQTLGKLAFKNSAHLALISWTCWRCLHIILPPQPLRKAA